MRRIKRLKRIHQVVGEIILVVVGFVSGMGLDEADHALASYIASTVLGACLVFRVLLMRALWREEDDGG